ncbi:MAG: Asp-tRNA(Asn)/Glu-tRNA(Gln) amidotransferase subunit GatC [Nitrososphaeria archaeon]
MSRVDVDRLRRLAAMEISPDEEAEVTSRLLKVIEYLDRLRSLDLSDIEPMYAAGEDEAAYRPDEPSGGDPDEVMRVVPKKKDRYVRAPKMM